MPSSYQDAWCLSRPVVRQAPLETFFFLNCFPASERVRNKNDTRPVTARQRHSKRRSSSRQGPEPEFQKRIVVRLGPGLGELLRRRKDRCGRFFHSSEPHSLGGAIITGDTRTSLSTC